MTQYQLWGRHPASQVWAAIGDTSDSAAVLYDQARQLVADPDFSDRYDRLSVWATACPYSGCDGKTTPISEHTGKCYKCGRCS